MNSGRALKRTKKDAAAPKKPLSSYMLWLKTASGPHLDLGCLPYVLYGVKYIDLVSLAPPFQARGELKKEFPDVGNKGTATLSRSP